VVLRRVFRQWPVISWAVAWRQPAAGENGWKWTMPWGDLAYLAEHDAAFDRGLGDVADGDTVDPHRSIS
jgi:hypothetical protein